MILDDDEIEKRYLAERIKQDEPTASEVRSVILWFSTAAVGVLAVAVAGLMWLGFVFQEGP